MLKHKLSKKDEEAKLAYCLACAATVPILLRNRNGRSSVWRCAIKHKSYRVSRPSNYKYRWALKEACERCGFIPEDKCQLDVDHIDGNHGNNDVANLQTLCANCHRLKTKLQKDGMYNR